jgi:co-chaperonin GroES (HSP10)
MLVPIKSKVLIELLEKETTTPGGIVLAVPDREDINKAKVIAIGDKVLDVQVGDTVLVNWNQAVETKYDDERKTYIIDETGIVLVFD